MQLSSMPGWVGPSDWSMHSTQPNGIGPGVCRKEGVFLERIHTKAAGRLNFPTKDATWHDESGDRREQSVTGNVLRFLFVFFFVYF